jgi:hypothetical protein
MEHKAGMTSESGAGSSSRNGRVSVATPAGRTLSTIACAGGSTWRPTMSRSLSGSEEDRT